MSAKRRGGDDAGEPTFAEAMRDVKPLPERTKTQPPVAPPPAPSDSAAGEPVEFEMLHSGDRLEGRAPGIDKKHLKRLRSGDVPIDVRIDLHGLLAREARAAVREALLAAAAGGKRCALVIHGRGRHSPGEPVLKKSLPAWLAEAPLGPKIMAFTSATPADGGAGATYILRRRPRPK
jgi:DNA-nicking Smr family endonuclease